MKVLGYIAAGAAGALLTLLFVGFFGHPNQAPEPSTPTLLPGGEPSPPIGAYTLAPAPTSTAGSWTVSVSDSDATCPLIGIADGYGFTRVVARVMSGIANLGGDVSGNFDGFGVRSIKDVGSGTLVKINVLYHSANRDDASHRIEQLCPGSFAHH